MMCFSSFVLQQLAWMKMEIKLQKKPTSEQWLDVKAVKPQQIPLME